MYGGTNVSEMIGSTPVRRLWTDMMAIISPHRPKEEKKQLEICVCVCERVSANVCVCVSEYARSVTLIEVGVSSFL